MSKVYKATLLLVCALLLFFLDFWSKSHVYNVMPFIGREGVPIFSHFLGGIDFSLNMAFNRGAAWGLLSDFQLPLLILRIVIVFILLIYLFFINTHKNMIFPLVLIITGALGNIADFFLYGSVVDFLQFTFWGWEFPLFNVADSMITIGVSILLLTAFFGKRRDKVAS